VKKELGTLFKKLELNSATATAIHLNTMELIWPYSSDLGTNQVCLCCLMSMPEKVLKCGHAICDTCIKLFGKLVSRNKYSIATCMICGLRTHDQYFHLLPPTAGIRILSMDGGGVRGIIPIIILCHLEQELALFQCKIGDFFDIVFGTSTGEIPHLRSRYSTINASEQEV
jgi:Patatin-like phospholipase